MPPEHRRTAIHSQFERRRASPKHPIPPKTANTTEAGSGTIPRLASSKKMEPFAADAESCTCRSSIRTPVVPGGATPRAENFCQVFNGSVAVVIGGDNTPGSKLTDGKNLNTTCAMLAGFIGSLLSIRAQALAFQTCPGLAGKSP